MKILTALVVTALFLTGCAKKTDSPEAVKAGVIRDLSAKFDMTKMDVIVDSVSFRDKEADAAVTFTVKGGSPSQGMKMNYVLARHDDNLWYIKSRTSAPAAGDTAGADAATGTPSLPPGHPATGQNQ